MFSVMEVFCSQRFSASKSLRTAILWNYIDNNNHLSTLPTAFTKVSHQTWVSYVKNNSQCQWFNAFTQANSTKTCVFSNLALLNGFLDLRLWRTTTFKIHFIETYDLSTLPTIFRNMFLRNCGFSCRESNQCWTINSFASKDASKHFGDDGSVLFAWVSERKLVANCNYVETTVITPATTSHNNQHLLH